MLILISTEKENDKMKMDTYSERLGDKAMGYIEKSQL